MIKSTIRSSKSLEMMLSYLGLIAINNAVFLRYDKWISPHLCAEHYLSTVFFII